MQKLDKQFHIHCVEGDVGRYCILPGDPGRCKAIAAHFDDAHFVAQNREYTIYTGTLLGEKVTRLLHRHRRALGRPSPWRSCTTSARIPSSGWAPAAASTWTSAPGDVVVATGAIRYEHTSREYAPIEFPAVAGLRRDAAPWWTAAKDLGKPRPHRRGPVQGRFLRPAQPGANARCPTSCCSKWEAWKRLGVKASEMESAALFVVAAALGVPLRQLLPCDLEPGARGRRARSGHERGHHAPPSRWASKRSSS